MDRGEPEERTLAFVAEDGAERPLTVTSATGAGGPRAAVLMLPGLSTPKPVAGPRIGPVIARELAARGLASARYAPRVNELPPDRAAAVDLEAEIGDAVGAARALAGLEELGGCRLVLLGISLGGVVAPVVAARAEGVAALASWGATARRWRPYAVDNLTIQLGYAGRPRPAIRRWALLLDRLYELLERTDRPASALLELEPAFSRLGLGPDGFADRSLVFWRQLLRLDPPSTYRGLGRPVLALRGEADCRAHPEDLDSIAKAAADAGLAVEAATLEGVDHGLLESAGPVASHRGEVGEVPRADLLAAALDRWLSAVVGRRASHA